MLCISPLFANVTKNGAVTESYPMGASGVAYNSQAGGWSIMGLSSITRQNKHGVPGYTNSVQSDSGSGTYILCRRSKSIGKIEVNNLFWSRRCWIKKPARGFPQAGLFIKSFEV